MEPHPHDWAVVATVDEPAVLVQAYAAWHLALGATSVTLYFDRPDDPAADLLAGVAGVRVVRCTPAHWARLAGDRPAPTEVRQARNANDAYRSCAAAWLLHSDADEFLWAAGGVAAALGAVDPATDVAVVPVAERFWRQGDDCGTIFAGAFRRPGPRGAAMSGDAALRLRGLTGHVLGKAFVRTRRDLAMSIHRPRARQPLPQTELRDIDLLHFDGLTPLHWLQKLRQRGDVIAQRGGLPASPHRAHQIAAVSAAAGGQAQVLHDRLKRLTDRQVAQLAARDLLLAVPFDPGAAMARWFGQCDLTPAAFDAALMLR